MAEEVYDDLPWGKPILAPIGSDGFVRDFDVVKDSAQDVQAFFDKYGFVVMRNVLTAEEADVTVDEFWESRHKLGLRRDDPRTWADFWESQRFGRLGIMGLGPDLQSLRQLENRQNPRVHQAFAKVLKTEDLWMDHDRLGIMRPTKNLDFGQGTVKDVEAWRTVSNWLHLDCNPLLGKASIASFADTGLPIDFSKTIIIQGLLTLTDARVEDGGFHCVPGSHQFALDWSALSVNQTHASPSNMQVPPSDPLRQRIQQIPIRKGCLLCWTSLLMHGNHPNKSEAWRAVQYIRAMPTSGTPYRPFATHLNLYNSSFRPSTLGRKVFGLDLDIAEGITLTLPKRSKRNNAKASCTSK